MKYTGISIGPILKTLAMARKPRELWSASYLFSYLMKCIYSEAEKSKAEILSPAKPDEKKTEVGIFPDRIFIKGECDAKTIVANARQTFFINLFEKGENPDLGYFNFMTIQTEAEKDSEAIESLNQKLDVMELWNFAATDTDSAQTIYTIISKENNNPLFKLATDRDYFRIKELEKIARTQLDFNNGIAKKSHHRYFCVVQADGDNMGKAISNPKLNNGEILEISKRLIRFGLSAARIINGFGGVPIYAGGDDLLFIAPVIGKDGTNIFNLIEKIESEAFKGVQDFISGLSLKNENDEPIIASLSFGIAISHHKHPLYEALETARNLLFDKAKQTRQKKAIAWSLRKHSGGSFSACFSRNESTLEKEFFDLLNATTDEATVSAVAHKIRQEETLVKIVLKSGQKERLDALFEKILEFTKENESYFNAVKALMPTLFSIIGEKDYAQVLYSLLRTAKFINGEELRDE